MRLHLALGIAALAAGCGTTQTIVVRCPAALPEVDWTDIEHCRPQAKVVSPERLESAYLCALASGIKSERWARVVKKAWERCE